MSYISGRIQQVRCPLPVIRKNKRRAAGNVKTSLALFLGLGFFLPRFDSDLDVSARFQPDFCAILISQSILDANLSVKVLSISY